jgi:hypothetical protein
MTPLELIFILFLVQLISYLLIDKYNAPKWKYLIFGLIMVGYIFIIPSFFFPDNPNNEPQCGMPLLGITLAFWILGCGTVIITHVFYLLIKRIITDRQKHGT